MADHPSYVPAEQSMPEFTPSAVLLGAILGIVFGASSLYLVLKVGMTVSASIPVAVLSITLFRWLGGAFGFRKTTILENNIVQTTGSAGESIAFGVGVTMPALMLIGFEMDWPRVMVVALLGGLLGILMMIPLRRAFIVKLHGKAGEPGKLLYPEGTACAQVLISGDKGGASGSTVFIGFGIAFAHKFITEGLNLLSASVSVPLKLGQNATDAFSRVARLSSENASELLGVGYIIGPRTASIMMGGAVLGALVIMPTLAVTGPANLDYDAISRAGSLRYIGAGCVAAAGIISMARTLPMIVRSIGSGVGSLRGGAGAVDRTSRVDDDLPVSFLLGGTVVLLGLLSLFLMREVGLLSAIMGAVLVVVFGFLFVTVSSRLTGEIGSSSNPISGMTVATLLMTCLIFLALGWTSPLDAVLALSIGGVVCIAASNGGTTSQDLKTGFLIGATPRLQQLAILVGALTSSLIIGGTLILFNQVGSVYSQRDLPQVNLKEKLGDLKETEDYQGETYHVWRPSQPVEWPTVADASITATIKPGKYLIDAQGWLAYHVDPTITGSIEWRDDFKPYTGDAVTLTPAQVKGLTTTVSVRPKQGEVPVIYRLWRNEKPKDDGGGESPAFRPDLKENGEYLVDANGSVAFANEPTKVLMKFSAPKTQVMGIIINGLLGKNLNWALILIGACLAVALELCGISSLAFAVGVYIPMQYSTPIFLGGLTRWGVDSWLAHSRATAGGAKDEVDAIAESESSPGTLLSSGLIAGGSLGGVLLAFMNFSESLVKSIDLSEPVAGAFRGISENPAWIQQLLAFGVFVLMAVVLLLTGAGKLFRPPPGNGADREAYRASRDRT
jgi:putative OPT family oligopeptide transporter